MKLAQLKDWVESHKMDDEEQVVVLKTLKEKLDDENTSYKSRIKPKINTAISIVIAFALLYVVFVTILSLL